MYRLLFLSSLLGSVAVAAPPALPSISLPGGLTLPTPPSGKPISQSSSSASPSASASSSSAASSAASAPSPHYTHFDCGVSLANAAAPFKDTINALHEHAKAIDAAGGNGAIALPPVKRDVLLSREASWGAELHARAATSIQVDLYIHVVETAAHKGQTTPAQVTAQVGAMNAAYNPYGISFTLKNASYTTNDVWAVGATDADDLAMKTVLRQGSYRSLNLYLQSDLTGGILGKCTLPTNVGVAPLPSVYTVDGCNIAAGSVPGGYIADYNQGKTAVHESGHWLGLLHNFEGYSCTGNGDYVTDTPAQSTATDGCPMNPWKDSCSAQAGLDTIRDYMDYSTDACYIRFSPGQVTRMMTLWSQFRLGK